jgi:S1-C subfamily serine protease
VNGCSRIDVKGVDALGGAEAHLVAEDHINDLALLQSSLKPKHVATLRTGVRLGEQVAAFGFPLAPLLSSSGNFTLGNITALAGLADDSRYFQISAPVQPGNSGGPLLDQSGNVVGIVAEKLNALRMMFATNGDIAQNVNFAIKASVARLFMTSKGLQPGGTPAAKPLAAPGIADLARSMSVLVECY